MAADEESSALLEDFWMLQQRVAESVRRQTCGDVEAGELLVVCDLCGAMRGATRPHGYTTPEQ